VIDSYNIELPDYEIGDFGLKPGEVKFTYDDEMKSIMPEAEKAFALIFEQTQHELGISLSMKTDVEMSIVPLWLMAVYGPGDGIGLHREGSENTHTLLCAMNDLPEDAGGDLQIENHDKKYAHRRGRVVIFPSDALHGNQMITKSVVRIGLAGLVSVL
jgi:hypothetical protein